MKKLLVCILLISNCLLFSLTTKAATTTTDTKEAVAMMTPEQQEQRMDEINARVQEIKNMDKTQLTKADRTELKEELKQMQKEAIWVRRGHPRIFISVVAVIVIIVLLIIIL